HTYALEGTYSTSVAINDEGGSTATANGTATIADAPLTGFGRTLTIDKKEYSGVVGQFSDGNALNNDPNQYIATINWGDGTTTTGTITRDATTGRWNVLGTHRYKQHDNYTISIAVSD